MYNGGWKCCYWLLNPLQALIGIHPAWQYNPISPRRTERIALSLGQRRREIGCWLNAICSSFFFPQCAKTDSIISGQLDQCLRSAWKGENSQSESAADLAQGKSAGWPGGVETNRIPATAAATTARPGNNQVRESSILYPSVTCPTSFLRLFFYTAAVTCGLVVWNWLLIYVFWFGASQRLIEVEGRRGRGFLLHVCQK